MRTIRLCLIWACLLTCALVPAQALTLTGTLVPEPSEVLRVPCAEYPGYACVTTAFCIQSLDYGNNASFLAAWNTAIQPLWNPNAWTLSFSTAPLEATLNISIYEAFNYGPGDPLYGSLYAGARLQIDWNPTGDQQSLKWIQAVHTNRPRQAGPQWYLDISNVAPERPPVYPYSYPDRHFYDGPSRPCEPNVHIFWEAWLYLAGVDRSANIATIYEGVYWGFSIDCLVVPEPGGALTLLGAGLWMGLAVLRRRGGEPHL